MADATGVLVVAQTAGEDLSSTGQELLEAGRRMSDALGEDLSVGVLGQSVERAAQQAIQGGADRVYAVTNPLLADYQADLYLAAIETLCRETAPNIILIGRTEEGRELAPRLAFRLGVGLAQDCLEVSVDPDSKRLLANRPVYGGNAVAVVSCEYTPQIAAVRPKVYEPREPDPSRQGEVVSFPVDLEASQAKNRILERVEEESTGVKLEDARVVVSGGRGLGGPEPFEGLGATGQAVGRRLGGVPCGGGLRVDTHCLSSGVDGEVDHSGPVHHGRDFRGKPAHGRMLRRQGHSGHQQGCRGQYLQRGPLRGGGRLAAGGAGIPGGGAGVDPSLADQHISDLVINPPLFLSLSKDLPTGL